MYSLKLFLLALATTRQVAAHPGAVAEGRATCGVEYSTPATAYDIPDVKEAWYKRRISTCEAPSFWIKFEITEESQELYVATMSPEIDRFRDQLQFNGILYGPGVAVDESNGWWAIPTELPPQISVRSDLGGAAYLKPPDSLGTCAFVDTNPVMRQFSELIEGRCMEEFVYDADSDSTLVQSSTVFNWWLYSFEHQAVEPGTYYLQTWLTPTGDSSQIAQGKYEMTIGPWKWFRYASQETLAAAQSQGTSCSCAFNELDYREHLLDRLGGVDSALFLSQLPGGTCGGGNDVVVASSTVQLPSMCYTIDKKAYRSEGSAIEWSGMWSLKAGVTYEWSYFAYFQGVNAGFDYPDPGMFVYVVESADIESVASDADSALKAAVDLEPTLTRAGGETLSIGDEIQYILFTDTSIANNTTVLFQPTEDVSIAVFTQHVPSEFMAHVIRNQETGEYVFPTSQTLYSDDVVVVASDDESGSSEFGACSMASMMLGLAVAMTF